MKKIFLTLLVINFSMAGSLAQKPEISLAIERWQGLWQGVNGSDSIILHIIQTVSPAEIDIKDKNFVGMYGWHAIKTGGKVIESSIESYSKKWNDKVTITGGYKHLSDSIHLVIQDLTRNRLLGAYLVLVNENEAILQTWMKETWRNDDKIYPSGQTYPKEIRLFRFPIKK